ncbi:MAG: hypothetical protein HYW71_02285 [Candidatus Niyogibacteria bacterium]|nr:hypothetical protein [Candidatus Niyogibacteria bacterium]
MVQSNSEISAGDLSIKEKSSSLRRRFKTAIYRQVIIFYFGLSAFTYFYFITIAVLYFGRFWNSYPTLSFLVSVFSEPYIGAVAVYTLLKEYRKKIKHSGSFHRGEVFVGAWALMLFASIILTFFSKNYHLDELFKIIVQISVAAILIYIGGVVHKP